MKDILPLIELSGTAEEIGLQHGKLLKDRIRSTITYYHGIFNRDEKVILEAARHYKEVITTFNRNYSVEIEAIARGAKVDPLWIYALNSRTEILTMFVTECTALYFSQSGLLAQNWDWAKALEELMVLMRITYPDGHTILQVTEPGIIGKIGMNSAGLGVTLNFLHMDGKLLGLPIHITLRHFLDARNIDQALTDLGDYRFGKSSNVIVGSDEQFVNLEFADDAVHETRDGEYFHHTNHFLEDSSLNTDMEKLKSSFSRYTRAAEILNKAEQTIEQIKSLLADADNAELPICRPYVPHEDIGDVGTVTSIIMDLKNIRMYVTRGNPFENEYEEFSL